MIPSRREYLKQKKEAGEFVERKFRNIIDKMINMDDPSLGFTYAEYLKEKQSGENSQKTAYEAYEDYEDYAEATNSQWDGPPTGGNLNRGEDIEREKSEDSEQAGKGEISGAGRKASIRKPLRQISYWTSCPYFPQF